MTPSGSRRSATGTLLGAIVLSASAVAQPPPGEEMPLSSDLAIRVRDGRSIELRVRTAPGEGYREIAARFTGSAGRAAILEKLNGPGALAPGGVVRIPLASLDDEMRAMVLLDLFPKDRREGGDWIHVARSGEVATYDEGMWQVAEWFTGDGSRYASLVAANGLPSPELAAGQEVRVPGSLLHPALRPRPTSDDGTLVYGSDAKGRYAGYRLKAGEALYSAVVVRFTGRTDPDDVNAVAEALASRSGIRNLKDIPIGWRVRIPFELLEPEFLPGGEARRVEAEAALRALAAELARHPVGPTRGGLEGVLVILDPGHGGRDVGTTAHGIFEHDYVYDVACRLKARLESDTAAHVFLTLEDAEDGCRPSVGDRLQPKGGGTLKTDPPFTAREQGETPVAVNLRWYLANSVLRKAVGSGKDPDRVVFLSLHADSRHASLRGLMVYVPGARYRRGALGERSDTYLRFREVREEPLVRFSKRQLLRSEAVSRRLASCVVDSFRREDLPVQPFEPVRDRVIRGRRTWLPAVLRGNAVPAKVLVEMVNLSNGQDAAVLAAASQRDRLSRALERSLLAYFGEMQSESTRASRSSR